jgi:PLP dependent protein
MMTEIDPQLHQNLAEVRNNIAAAARRSGRQESAITLVAVTKAVDANVAQMLVAAGCRDLGESRPQELWTKTAAIRAAIPENAVRWHIIGHLQRNKVRRTLPLVSLVHSVDSVRLLEEIDRESRTFQQPAAVLLEVNISGDQTKHGFRPNEVERQLPEMAKCEHTAIHGLMCMASREGDQSQARREFAALRELRDRLQRMVPPSIRLTELSMGMSGDYEVAVEEGATIVRIGSALFEGISATGS